MKQCAAGWIFAFLGGLFVAVIPLIPYVNGQPAEHIELLCNNTRELHDNRSGIMEYIRTDRSSDLMILYERQNVIVIPRLWGGIRVAARFSADVITGQYVGDYRLDITLDRISGKLTSTMRMNDYSNRSIIYVKGECSVHTRAF